jgi:transposase
MEGLTLIFLPPYSPELNPAERFFQEIRKATANRIFETLGEQEKKIEQKVIEYAGDKAALRTLTGYEWIRKQMEGVF